MDPELIAVVSSLHLPVAPPRRRLSVAKVRLSSENHAALSLLR